MHTLNSSLNYPKIAATLLGHTMSHPLHLGVQIHHYSTQSLFQLQSILKAHFPCDDKMLPLYRLAANFCHLV